MLSISIDRSSLGALPLTIDDDGTGAFSLMPGFSAGQSVADNTYAESRWLNGGVLTSSRRPLTSLEYVVRCNTTTLAALQTAVAELAEAVEQFTFLVTVTEDAIPTVYECMSATWFRLYGKTAMLNGHDSVALSIPRQP